MLLVASGNPDLAGHDGMTPLHVAAWHGHTDIIRILIQAGTLLLQFTLHAQGFRQHLVTGCPKLQTVRCFGFLVFQGDHNIWDDLSISLINHFAMISD